MSDHAAVSHDEQGTDISPSPSFMVKNRLKLMIAGGFFAFLLILIIGVAIGMTKRKFEKTQYIEQIARLKVSFEETIETRKELEEKISELKNEVKEKKIEAEELAIKVEDLERQIQRGGSAAAPHAPAAAAGGESAGADVKTPGGGYVKFGGGDCVLPAGGGKGSAAWKECMNQNRGAQAKPAEEPAAAKHEPKTGH